jgi:hypothetical protein
MAVVVCVYLQLSQGEKTWRQLKWKPANQHPSAMCWSTVRDTTIIYTVIFKLIIRKDLNNHFNYRDFVERNSATVHINVFQDVMLSNFVGTNVSCETSASIFRVSSLNLKIGGRRYLHNIYTYYFIYRITGVMSKVTIILFLYVPCIYNSTFIKICKTPQNVKSAGNLSYCVVKK